MTLELDRYLTTAAVADLTGYSAGYLRALRSKGTGPAWVRMQTNGVRYRQTDVIAWLESTTPTADQ